MDTDRRAEERALGRATGADRLDLFAVMWALAALWHLLGDPAGSPAWAQAWLALAIGVVLWRPGPVVPLALLAVAGLVVAWEEAPALGDAWLLATLVNLSITLAVLVGVVRRRPTDRPDLAERLFPAARLCLLGAYGFSALARLNSAFFDRVPSCAVFVYRETTDSVGLAGLQFGGAAWLERGVIATVAALGVLIPLLLVARRTRGLGVMTALVFHALVALDRTSPHFSNSAVLFPLLVLFLPPTTGHWISERVGSIRARLALRHPRLPIAARAALAIAPASLAIAVAIDIPSVPLAMDIGWWLWLIVAVVIVGSTSRLLRQSPGPSAIKLVPYHPVYLLAPLLVVANGLSPYLELKTVDTWSSYSNLRTVDGYTNHLVVPRTLPLTDSQADLVEIIDTDDPVLAAYRARDLAITWDQLRSRLSQRPDVSITYRRGSEVVVLARAAEDPRLSTAPAQWRYRLLPFNPVERGEQERCRP